MRILLPICASVILLGAIVSAQTPTPVVVTPLTDIDIQLLRADVQAGKNQIITDTMLFHRRSICRILDSASELRARSAANRRRPGTTDQRLR
jgi:hypothetical protein